MDIDHHDVNIINDAKHKMFVPSLHDKMVKSISFYKREHIMASNHDNHMKFGLWLHTYVSRCTHVKEINVHFFSFLLFIGFWEKNPRRTCPFSTICVMTMCHRIECYGAQMIILFRRQKNGILSNNTIPMCHKDVDFLLFGFFKT